MNEEVCECGHGIDDHWEEGDVQGCSQLDTDCDCSGFSAAPPGETGGRTHDLKCWPPFFEDIKYGRKTFEVRDNDRDYQVGDVLRLREYVPPYQGKKGYTGRECERVVTYIADLSRFVGPPTIGMSLAALDSEKGKAR